MAYITYLLGALLLGLIAIGLWTALDGLKAIVTRRVTLKNVTTQMTIMGPVRMAAPPTRVEGELAIRHGAIQLIGGLLIAGPLALVPLLGGGFPWTILLGPAVGFGLVWIGTRVTRGQAAGLADAPSLSAKDQSA